MKAHWLILDSNEKVTTLYEKYKEDIDALKRLKRERFENPVVKSLLAEEA